MNQINFLPKDYLLKQERAARRVRQTLLIIVVLFCMVGWWLGAYSRVADLNRYANALDIEVHAANVQMLEMVKLKGRREALAHQLNVQRELAQPLAHMHVLTVIAELMPESMATRQIALTSTGLNTRPNRTGKNSKPGNAPVILIELEGIAPNDVEVADFVGQLTDHVLFKQVKMLYARQVELDDVIAREFRVEMRVPMNRVYQVNELPLEEVAHAD